MKQRPLDLSKLEAIVQDLKRLLPEGTEQFQDGVRRNVRLVAESVIDRLELVTREEFDTQRAVLARTREKLELLEARLRELETRLSVETD